MRLGATAVIGAFIVAAGVSGVPAQDLTYRPINPSFGGDPFNSQHLLGTLDRQKRFRESIEPRDPLADIDRIIQRSVLSRVTAEITRQIFGEDARDSGTFIIENTTIHFQRVGDDMRIEISDAGTGGRTVIQVPVMQF